MVQNSIEKKNRNGKFIDERIITNQQREKEIKNRQARMLPKRVLLDVRQILNELICEIKNIEHLDDHHHHHH